MDIYTAIGSLGFPIVMCVWLMFSFNKTIQKNTKVLETLVDLIREKLK